MMQTAEPAKRAAQPVALAAGFALLALGAAPGFAQDPDRVVATTNGVPITEGEAIETLQRMPPQVQQQPLPMVLPMVVQQIAIGRIIHQRAIDAGYAEDEEVARRLADAERAIIQDVWVENRLEEALTEEAVATEYETFKEQNPPAEEVSARHILLETEEDAKAVIEELNGGADFATLAQEKSTGPSGPSGGDLGYFTREQMVPEFAEAAFSLEPGSITEEPVQTQFGWHVIKVEDARTVEPPSLEEVRPQLEDQVRQAYLRELVAGIQSDADIVFMDQDGNPIDTGDGDAAEGEAEAEEGAAEEEPAE